MLITRYKYIFMHIQFGPCLCALYHYSGMMYSREVTPSLLYYVAKREKRVKEVSSLLSLESGLSLRGHGVQGRSCVRPGAEVKPSMLPRVSP
ncbi:hypothetical protein NEPAR06_0011 [Nematocida parisii]|uniref:uncharacterized protein n=1 Tax=Nematocida parisii (strain ERTm1 / ATCC PRA-289) TaxID=881290 RepID=UPI000264BA4C|nr:uncharacterized protein NEPG_00103 [Nematocida parisii ERTm1]EIJ94580.1 hypothetical protein NEPG_00103 [Nematocida parisii ERTm1]KAI5142706.1 hypothetical protein NEPAR07_0232 [Nematocida parisii]KAI5152890.1 hypothetical protein NEPAR06_0011 [Nematocida parisii]KAI5157282.1 hypothetical protein NEPAR05_1147 [Nematocida parisii]|eukprot:XP_013057937.1 hypothetical protein NEPG_00103 [Nematocida parisii ERTm1]